MFIEYHLAISKPPTLLAIENDKMVFLVIRRVIPITGGETPNLYFYLDRRFDAFWRPIDSATASN